jgi:CRISPR/Cas system endoribonuclease Cas6 (RAMP superfamily)
MPLNLITNTTCHMKLRIFHHQAARTSETSVDIQLRILQYIPEDSEFHTRLRENLKSHYLLHCMFIQKKCRKDAWNDVKESNASKHFIQIKLRTHILTSKKTHHYYICKCLTIFRNIYNI